MTSWLENGKFRQNKAFALIEERNVGYKAHMDLLKWTRPLKLTENHIDLCFKCKEVNIKTQKKRLNNNEIQKQTVFFWLVFVFVKCKGITVINICLWITMFRLYTLEPHQTEHFGTKLFDPTDIPHKLIM